MLCDLVEDVNKRRHNLGNEGGEVDAERLLGFLFIYCDCINLSSVSL